VKTDKGTIRKVRFDEIERLSAMIRNTLLISNSLDYDINVIRNLSRQYSSRNVHEMAMRRNMYVHLTDDVIDGTVSLKGDTIFAFFVAPDKQGSGIGSRLLEFVEDLAKASGVGTIKVEASVTAKDFYLERDYRIVAKEKNAAYGAVYSMKKELL
jgi:putative acetyltransferase